MQTIVCIPAVRVLRGLGLAFLLFLVLSHQAFGFADQAKPLVPEYLIQTWQVDQGLPENSATSMVQTPDGYLWFGTYNGLVRFDGVKFTVFDRSNTPELPSAAIVNLHLDRRGGMWVSTILGMAYVKDGHWRTFGKDSGWSGDYVRSVAETPAGDLYFSTFNGKLLQFRNDHFEELPPTGSVMQDEKIGYFLHLDESGALWAIHSSFIGKLVNGKWQPTSISAEALLKEDGLTLEGATVTATTARDGGLWLATNHVLRKYRNGKLVLQSRSPWPLAFPWDLYEDPSGNLWLCSNGAGVYRFSPDGAWKHFTKEDGLSYDIVRFVFEDHETNLWVGTTGGGLMRFNTRHFQTIGSKEGLPDRIVKTITSDSQGQIFVGMHGQGVAEIGGPTIRRLFLPGSPVLTKNDTGCSVFDGLAISSLVDSQGRLWIGSDDSGLYRFDKAGAVGGCKALFASRKSPPFYSLFEDSHGMVWAGTDGDILRFQGDAMQRFVLKNAPAESSIRSFAENPQDGTLWASNDGGGLYQLQGDSFVPATGAEQLSHQQLSALMADKNGTLWIGTEDGGIACLRNGHLTRITEKQGLPARSIGSILDDQLGNLWFGSNRGILRVSRAELESLIAGKSNFAAFHVFDTSDGLSSLEFSTGSQPTATRAPDGKLWFATWTGVVMVDPAKLPHNPLPPPMTIASVLIDGHEASSQRQFATSDASAPFVITVPPGSHRLEIHYAGLSFTAPERVQYRYMLEGLDHDWIDVGGRQVIYLQDVKPGTYRFRVKAANNDGIWNEDGAYAQVIIQPHFYETAWFYTVCILAFGGLGFGIYRLKVRNLKARQAELESRVTERTKELQQQIAAREREVAERKRAEDEARAASKAKSTFLATMSHEIRTPMNGILGMTDLVLETDLDPAQRQDLMMVKSSAESLLTVINDILDFSKIEAGKLDFESIDFSLRECVEQALEPLCLRADQKGLELIYDIRGDVPASLIGDPGRLRQVLVNLAGNALKFTEHGEIVIRVELEAEQEEHARLHFSVIDTGIGILPELRKKIFEPFTQADGSTTRKFGGTGLGLAICRRLVEMMEGKIWVDAGPDGVGSAFQFTVQLGVQKHTVPRSAPVTLAELRGLGVLIVDDNATNRHMLLELLQRWGMRPVAAENGPAALRELSLTGRDISLILLDSHMPEMDGFMFAERIRENPTLTGATIMMLTSSGGLGDTTRCKELGISSYLIKPVRQKELLDTIRKMLGARPRIPAADNYAPDLMWPGKPPIKVPTHSANGNGEKAQPAKQNTLATILLAEDNDVNQKLAVRLLQKQNYTVIVAANGRIALEELERNHIDLVLMDVDMPEMDGFEATAEIRKRENGGKRIPIIAMTAHAMKGDQERCLMAGMDDYLAKPIVPAKLFEKVAKLLKHVAFAPKPN